VDYEQFRGLGTAALWATTFVLSFVSGIIPYVLSIELFLVAVATLTDASPVAIVGLSTAAQTIAKYILYLVGKGTLNVSWIKRGATSKTAMAFAKRPGSSLGIVAASAVLGFPPLYPVSLAAGALRLPLIAFVTIVTIGRIVRFGAIYLAPDLLESLW
jgi:membrane protein YqaA with SNARE-associated domain